MLAGKAKPLVLSNGIVIALLVTLALSVSVTKDDKSRASPGFALRSITMVSRVVNEVLYDRKLQSSAIVM